MKLRKARPDDATAMVAIKDQLPLTLSDGSTSTGGFLLGTDEATYRSYINTSWCLVAEHEEQVIGFGIMLPDAVLRSSDIWLRRNEAAWREDIAAYEQQQLCYFEQFAFLPGHRRAAIALAYRLTSWAYDAGSETLFTTTVHKPVRNLAAVPFIYAAGGHKAGSIDEIYPLVGQILSDIYVIPAAAFRASVATHPLCTFFFNTPQPS